MLKLELIERSVNELIYTVKESENLLTIASKFEVTASQIDTLGNKNIDAGDRVIIDLTKRIYHIVMPGQTIYDIAKLYGVEVEQIKKNNNISRLFVGQRLLISCHC